MNPNQMHTLLIISELIDEHGNTISRAEKRFAAETDKGEKPVHKVQHMKSKITVRNGKKRAGKTTVTEYETATAPQGANHSEQ